MKIDILSYSQRFSGASCQLQVSTSRFIFIGSLDCLCSFVICQSDYLDLVLQFSTSNCSLIA